MRRSSDYAAELEEEIRALKATLACRDREIRELKHRLGEMEGSSEVPKTMSHDIVLPPLVEKELEKEEVERYGRQLILPELRPAGQRKLKASSALVVGCGGLGCPAAAYLAAAGVGRLGLVDHDTLELSNLHRQVLHTQARVGVAKAVSLATSMAALNPSVEVVPYTVALTSATALGLIGQYDVVLDCTDNVATRYLLSDACVMLGRPLVSGSALRWEGQVTVYNHRGGPTYRCLYPEPPPAAAVTSCSEGGVLGAVPGVIGCLQALETVKVLAGLQPAYSGSLLLFDGLEGRARLVKLRGRKEDAEVRELIDYEQFCGAAAVEGLAEVQELGRGERVTARELAEVRRGQAAHLVVDVRPEVEVEICRLEGSVSLPLARLAASGEGLLEVLRPGGRAIPIFLICRRGNDSQAGVRVVQELLPGVEVRDVVGGLQAWTTTVDPSFPVY